VPPKQDDPLNKGQAMRDSIAEQQRTSRRRYRGKVEAADWREATPDKISHAIHSVTQHGFAIRFGYTKDGGAFAIGILGDGEPFTEFVRATEDIDLYLDGITANYADTPDQ
jgi:ribonuclease BN (tRNA processing enzyme)